MRGASSSRTKIRPTLTSPTCAGGNSTPAIGTPDTRLFFEPQNTSTIASSRLSPISLPAPQVAGREGTVTGTLTVEGVPVAITHVYATVQPGFFDKKTEDVHVLLSDVALSDEAREDVFELTKLAEKGEAHMVEITIDAQGSPIGGSLFAKRRMP